MSLQQPRGHATVCLQITNQTALTIRPRKYMTSHGNTRSPAFHFSFLFYIPTTQGSILWTDVAIRWYRMQKLLLTSFRYIDQNGESQNLFLLCTKSLSTQLICKYLILQFQPHYMASPYFSNKLCTHCSSLFVAIVMYLLKLVHECT